MKRKFKIICERTNTLEGYLYYDTTTKTFSMTIVKAPYSDIDWFFEIMQERKIIDVPQHLVDMWVDGRIIPPNRQGIEDILREMEVNEYDRFTMLKYNDAWCQMDTTYIQEIT